jgi:CRP-like cAMP-binding protein
VVCSQFHTIQKRLCRWLLIARDVMKLDRLDLTQEIISHVLGIPRTGVTMAAVELQRAGLISYSRGHITILNQQELESASCECYRLVKDEFTGLRG